MVEDIVSLDPERKKPTFSKVEWDLLLDRHIPVIQARSAKNSRSGITKASHRCHYESRRIECVINGLTAGEVRVCNYRDARTIAGAGDIL